MRWRYASTALRAHLRGWSDPTTGCSCPQRVRSAAPTWSSSSPRRTATATTFDGRDLFGPAAAHLARGGDPGSIGTSVPPSSLVSRAAPSGPPGSGGGLPAGGGDTVVASVTWIDRFGNVQLDLGAGDLDRLGLAPGGWVDVELEAPGETTASTGASLLRPSGPVVRGARARRARRVDRRERARRAGLRSRVRRRDPRVCGARCATVGASPGGARRPLRLTGRSDLSCAAPPRRTIQAVTSEDTHRGTNPRPAAPGPSRRRIPEATVARLPDLPADPRRVVAIGDHDGLFRAARFLCTGQRGEGAQGPLAARFVRHPRCRVRRGVPHRADRPRARPRPDLAGGHRGHRQPRARAHPFTGIRRPQLLGGGARRHRSRHHRRAHRRLRGLATPTIWWSSRRNSRSRSA